MSNVNVTNFINQLKEWGKRETGAQRTAMAELRRGLQEFPQLSPSMHRYIAPFTRYATGWEKQTCYLVAALFARYHAGSQTPQYSNAGYLNMGSYFATVVRQDEGGSEAIERRFNALLTAHPQDLHYQLRQAIAFLHSKQEANIAINWQKIYYDILDWNDDEKRWQTQERWASQFWRHQSHTTEQINSESNTKN